MVHYNDKKTYVYKKADQQPGDESYVNWVIGYYDTDSEFMEVLQTKIHIVAKEVTELLNNNQITYR